MRKYQYEEMEMCEYIRIYGLEQTRCVTCPYWPEWMPDCPDYYHQMGIMWKQDMEGLPHPYDLPISNDDDDDTKQEDKPPLFPTKGKWFRTKQK